MTSIINTTDVQQNIGQISANIGGKSYIVTRYGRGHIVMLPYFDGCNETIKEYLEDYEMYKNKKKLVKRYKKSIESGISDLRM